MSLYTIIPKEDQDSAIDQILMDFWKYNINKALFWLEQPNPHFAGYSPVYLYRYLPRGEEKFMQIIFAMHEGDF